MYLTKNEEFNKYKSCYLVLATLLQSLWNISISCESTKLYWYRLISYRGISTHCCRHAWEYWCNNICYIDAKLWSNDSRSYLFNADSVAYRCKVSIDINYLLVLSMLVTVEQLQLRRKGLSVMLMFYNACFYSKSGMLPLFCAALLVYFEMLPCFSSATAFVFKSAYFSPVGVIIQKYYKNVFQVQTIELFLSVFSTLLCKPMCSSKWSRMASVQLSWACWHGTCPCPWWIKTTFFFFFFPSRELSFPVHLYSDTSLFLLRFSGNASSSFVLSLLLLTKIIVNVNLFGFDRTSKHFVQWCC